MKLKNEDKKDISVYILDIPLYLLEYIIKYLRPKLNFNIKDRLDKKGKSYTLIVLKEKKNN